MSCKQIFLPLFSTSYIKIIWATLSCCPKDCPLQALINDNGLLYKFRKSKIQNLRIHGSMICLNQTIILYVHFVLAQYFNPIKAGGLNLCIA